MRVTCRNYTCTFKLLCMVYMLATVCVYHISEEPYRGKETEERTVRNKEIERRERKKEGERNKQYRMTHRDKKLKR